MPYFSIFDHPKLPLVVVRLEKRRRDVDKDGFRLRYVLPLPSNTDEGHADDVIDLLDGLMGARTRSHGVYQAKYEEVRAAYGSLFPPEESDDTNELLRAGALLLAVPIGAVSAVALVAVTFGFLIFAAFRRQSGFAAMAEYAILCEIVDARPLVHKLLLYWRDGKWPQ